MSTQKGIEASLLLYKKLLFYGGVNTYISDNDVIDRKDENLIFSMKRRAIPDIFYLECRSTHQCNDTDMHFSKVYLLVYVVIGAKTNDPLFFTYNQLRISSQMLWHILYLY